jgi:hypothetical protein
MPGPLTHNATISTIMLQLSGFMKPKEKIRGADINQALWRR